jgi:hypothetical protein
MSSNAGPHLSATIICEECRRLLNDFCQAVREVTELHANQSSAVIQGDIDFGRFDLLIHLANEKKNRAKYAYMTHIEQHGRLKARASA